MALTFYPHSDDVQKGTLKERVEVLQEAAERFKAVILDVSGTSEVEKKSSVPRDQTVAYNWEEIARLLREVRELPEASREDKTRKADLLTKLSEVYEILRGAKMSKLEAVRLALISEANHLRGSSTQVA